MDSFLEKYPNGIYDIRMIPTENMVVPKLDSEGFNHLTEYVLRMNDFMEVNETIRKLKLAVRIFLLSKNQFTLEEWETLAVPAATLSHEILELVRRRNDIILSPGGEEFVARIASKMLLTSKCKKSAALSRAMSDQNKVIFLKLVTWSRLPLHYRILLLEKNIDTIGATPPTHDHEAVRELVIDALRECPEMEYRINMLDLLICMFSHTHPETTGSKVCIGSYIGGQLNLPSEVMLIDIKEYSSATRRLLEVLNAAEPSTNRIISLSCLRLHMSNTEIKGMVMDLNRLEMECVYDPIWLDLSPISKNMRLESNQYLSSSVTFRPSNLVEIRTHTRFYDGTDTTVLTFIRNEPIKITVPNDRDLSINRFRMMFKRDELFIEAENHFFMPYYGPLYGPNSETNIVVKSSINQDLRGQEAIAHQKALQDAPIDLSFNRIRPAVPTNAPSTSCTGSGFLEVGNALPRGHGASSLHETSSVTNDLQSEANSVLRRVVEDFEHQNLSFMSRSDMDHVLTHEAVAHRTSGYPSDYGHGSSIYSVNTRVNASGEDAEGQQAYTHTADGHDVCSTFTRGEIAERALAPTHEADDYEPSLCSMTTLSCRCTDYHRSLPDYSQNYRETNILDEVLPVGVVRPSIRAAVPENVNQDEQNVEQEMEVDQNEPVREQGRGIDGRLRIILTTALALASEANHLLLVDHSVDDLSYRLHPMLQDLRVLIDPDQFFEGEDGDDDLDSQQ